MDHPPALRLGAASFQSSVLIAWLQRPLKPGDQYGKRKKRGRGEVG